MAIDIDKMFTINEDSIRHSLDILIDQRFNFRPISKEKYIELVKIDLKDIPFNGTLKERKELIETTMNKLMETYINNGKLKVLEIENIENNESTDNNENTENNESTDNIEDNDKENNESTDNNENTENTENTESTDSTDNIIV